MRDQVLAIIWAQFRISRNHFPRTTAGTVLSWCVTGIWYLLFAALAVIAAVAIKEAPDEYLVLGLSSGLLGIFAYMQLMPLVTASAGWSLQVDKLQAFPIAPDTLFLIEVILRITSSPEMLILLAGGFVGLVLRTGVFPLAPLFLLLFLSFSLLLQLAIRDFILHSFSKSRYREILTVLFLCMAFLPQLIVRSTKFAKVKPYLLLIANGSATPWHQMARLSLGQLSFDGIAAIVCWNLMAGIVARRQFLKSLRQEDSFRPPTLFNKTAPGRFDLIGSLTHRLSDPFGALVQKELRTLLRMPRFRIVFGMACLFSILIFLPLTTNSSSTSFVGQNTLPMTSLYGLLLMSDAILLNIFGFDRGASQLYFMTPASLSVVIRAKNLAAVFFVALQAAAVPVLSMLFHLRVNAMGVLAAFLSSAVVTIFLLAAGNLMSVYLPRPVDPRSSFRRQGSKSQLWLLLCTFGMFLLVGMAFVARWATDRDWVMLAILGVEFAIGLLVYRISLDETVSHAMKSKERIVGELSKGAAPLGSS
jgi:ABC-2 type transport system permease protein